MVSLLAILSIIYSSIAALSLLDLKGIIAYSSVVHMAVATIGLFSNDLNGLSGAFLYSISHGLISSGLFFLAGALYDRYGTRNIKYYRGLTHILPLYVVLLLLFSLSNISFPLSSGFIAEI